MPVDDPLFDQISSLQWLWYAAQFATDDKEQFELFRDIAEYNASFWNPAGVEQVRRARERTFVVSDKNFSKQVKELFGRKLNIPERKESFIPSKQEISGRPKMRSDVDARVYLETELDEVRFTPIGR